MGEEHVRQLLLSIDTAHASPDPVARVRRRMRRRTSTIGIAAGLAVVAVLGASAAAAGRARSRDQGLVPVTRPSAPLVLPDVPFAARPYPALASRPAPPTERFCGSRDVTLLATTAPRGPNAIGVQLTVRLTNVSRTACQVPFTGAVTVDSATGTIGQGNVGSNRASNNAPQPAVPPGGTAVLSGYWAESCKTPTVPVSAHVTLTRSDAPAEPPISVSGPLKAGATPSCEQPPLKVIYVDGTASLYSLVVLDAKQRRIDNPGLSLTAELVDVPTAVHVGEALHFGVRLHNPAAGPIALTGRSCPLYATLLNRAGRSGYPAVDGAMNCQDGPAALPAGADVTFRFEFPVPPSGFRAGAWTLYWTRTDGGDAQLTAAVQVLPSTPAVADSPCQTCRDAPAAVNNKRDRLDPR